MPSQSSAPSRRRPLYASYSALEWRSLLRLLVHLETLPTSAARAHWMAKLHRENAELATALLQLVAARDGAISAGFMAAPLIKRGELRRHVDVLVRTRPANV